MSLPGLDLNRRRVAAISFLANISTEEGMGTEIRLDCLQVILASGVSAECSGFNKLSSLLLFSID